MESPDEILRLPGRTPRARHRQHYSVIASKEFRQLDRIIKEFLPFSVTVRPQYFSGSSQVFAFLLIHPAGHIIIKFPPPSSSTAASEGSHSTPRWKSSFRMQSLNQVHCRSDQPCGVLVARDALFLCCRGFAQDLKDAGKACSEL
jgi:hypothetical protein